MALRYYRNGPARALASPIALASDTTMTVDSASGFPTQFPYTAILEPNTALEEVVDVTAAAGNVLTIVRGVDSTTASAHASGSAVWHGVSARDPREANAHVNATTGVHGGVGSVVDTDSAQTIIGAKNFTGGLTTTNGAVVTVAGTQTVNGAKTFDTLSTTAGGAVVGTGDVQTITGAKTFSGPLILSGFDLTAASGTAWTPVWTATGTAPALGNGTLTGRYFRIGNLVVAWVNLTLGSTTTMGTNTWGFSLPFPRDTAILHLGSARIFQSGVTYRAGVPVATANVVNVFVDAFASAAGATTPHTWVSGDALNFMYVYIAA